MALTDDLIERYGHLARQLLPRGAAWNRSPDSVLARLLAAVGTAFARIHDRADALVIEGRPLTAVEALPDWEEEFGLPDACAPISDSVYERQLAVWRKQVEFNACRPADFIEIAAQRGYEIEIDTYEPATTDSTVDARVYDIDWTVAWLVRVLSSANSEIVRAALTTDSTVDERIDGFSGFDIECVFQKLKPSQTYVFFAYA